MSNIEQQCDSMVSYNDISGGKPDNQQVKATNFKPYPRLYNEFATPYSSKNMVVENVEPSKHVIPAQIYPNDREWSIVTDHCYARPWNWRPESNFLRPTKTLFVRKQVVSRKISNAGQPSTSKDDDIIDIETVSELPPPIYDEVKSKQLMEECEKHAALAKADEGDEDWEANVSRLNWTPTQHRIFDTIVSILNNDHLARLANSGGHSEPIIRRTVIDKSVQRVRRLLATVAWDAKIIQWLHLTLVENLNKPYLACYLDILQTLKSKLPTFVDKMLYGPGGSSNRLGVLNNENLFPLLKRPWDPVASSLSQEKPKKLPTNPLLVIVPSSYTVPKRIQKWINLLSNLATVVTIPVNLGTTGYRMTMVNYLDQMYATTKGKIQELKADYPGRNIVLIGFNAGATLALQIAQIDTVLCVVCIGFSLMTVDGKRGDPEDSLLKLQCPVLFVTGQCSNTSSQEEMEELRERMKVETGLIIVGSADDYLRINKKKKKLERITQSVVDRSVLDEIGEFISGIILSPYPPHIRQSPTHVSSESKKIKNERKRYNSNASSLDSEPPSPTPRITRPVGRPPGSKTKSKMETKWSTQGIPSSPTSSNSPPPSQTPFTPDTSSNDSSLTEKSESAVKKIKTLKPTVLIPGSSSPDKPLKQSASSPLKSSLVKQHGFNYPSRMSVPGASPMSTFSQGGIKTIPPTHQRSSASSIKVLENVTLNSTNSGKFFPNMGRGLDLSKITLVNSIPTKAGGGLGNVLLLPDGKIKAVSATKGGKYITSKKQLIGNKPPKPMKKISYISHAPIQTNLPPPTNLTTQDIMDLPIIFADDNQILEGNSIQPEAPQPQPSTPSTSHHQHSSQTAQSHSTTGHPGSQQVQSVSQVIQLGSQPTQCTSQSIQSGPLPLTSQSQTIQSHTTMPSKIITSAGNKFVLLNKQVTSQVSNNFIITPTNIRKMPPLSAVRNPKYTKIILSKRDEPKSSVMAHISNLSPEISVRKVLAERPSPSQQIQQSLPPEPIDLENELIATAVPKPNLANSDVKNITVFSKKSPDSIKTHLMTKPLTLASEGSKRPLPLTFDTEDEDVVDMKQVKLSPKEDEV